MRHILFTLIAIASVFELCFGSDSGFDDLYRKYRNEPMPVLKELGQSLLTRGSTDSAMAVYTIITNRYESDKRPEDGRYAVEARNSLGVISFLNSNYASAYSHFVTAVELDGRPDAAGNMNLSAIYLYYGDRKRAYDLLRQVFDEAIDKGHFYWASASLINILTSDIDDSVVPDDSIAVLIRRYNDKVPYTKDNPAWALAAHLSKAKLLDMKGNHEGAIREYRFSLTAASSLLIPSRNEFASYIGMGKTFMKTGQPDSAVYYVKKAESIARENGFAELLISAYSDLSEIYGSMGRKDIADMYRYKKLELNDSVFSTKEFGKIRDLEMFHEADKFERRISLLQIEEKMRTRILWLVSSSLILVAALCIYIFIQNHRLRRKNKDLYDRNVAAMKAEEKWQKEMERLRTIRSGACVEDVRVSGHESGDDDDSHTADSGNGIAFGKYAGSRLDDVKSRKLEQRINEVLSDETVFCREGFSLKDLADLCCSNSKYVSQVLNERMDTTFSQLLNERRVSVARKRFVDFEHYGHLTIEAIVAELGFRSRSTFSKTFKKITGLSPSEFQRLARNNENT